MIKEGVLKNYHIPLYVANKLNLERSGNMSYNFIVDNGDVLLKDMIKNVKKGILVGGFAGGLPNKNGDFSGVAKNSFLIENGEIKCAINEVMISGNILNIFNSIVAISKEQVINGSSVIPYITFSNVVISGK